MIERVELLILCLPLVFPFETSFGRINERTILLIKLYSNGIEGWGEVVSEKLPQYSYETIETSWHVLKDILIPMALKEKELESYKFHKIASQYKGHPMAKAGFELALWDLEAKKRGISLSKLWGGEKDKIQAGVSLGIEEKVEFLMNKIENFLKKGYQRIKVKIRPGWDVNTVKEIRKYFPEIKLMVDANCSYRIDQIGVLKKLDNYNLMMIEQPFYENDLWQHAKLQRNIKTPICLDESIKSINEAVAGHEMGSYKIINMKVGRIGGWINANEIHKFAVEKNIPLWCGGMLESGIGRAHNVHLSSMKQFILPNDISESRRYFKEDLVNPPFELTNKGTIKVPSSPGIGVKVEEKFLKKIIIRKEIVKI
ncbi:MAG: o-succinylbenzoate synthase [Acidobacteriota bacterium]